MALLPGSDLEIDKVLMWKTKIPFEKKQRQSSYFTLMGLEWCLRFSYEEKIPKYWHHCVNGVYIKDTDYIYHVIPLHRVIDGHVVNATAASSQQLRNSEFRIKTSLVQPAVDTFEDKGAMHAYVGTDIEKVLWCAGSKNNALFTTLPYLFRCCYEVKVVCKFYGQPLSSFKLGKQLYLNSGELDKSVQVSSEVPLDFQTISNDFSDLLEKEILPDVKLECGGQTIKAHRSILAARSNVFQAMFQNKMLESETGAIKINDMDVAVLLMLLKFLYSAKSEDLSEDNIVDLYEAADKYDVLSLKTACVYWVIRNLTVENCVKYLKVADSHSDSDLKAAVISFIIKNSDVLKSAEWLVVSKELSVLAVEVLQAYFTGTDQLFK